jgi:hypothetical protein
MCVESSEWMKLGGKPFFCLSVLGFLEGRWHATAGLGVSVPALVQHPPSVPPSLPPLASPLSLHLQEPFFFPRTPPYAPLATHWLLSALLMQVMDWSPPLTYRVGTEGQ